MQKTCWFWLLPPSRPRDFDALEDQPSSSTTKSRWWPAASLVVGKASFQMGTPKSVECLRLGRKTNILGVDIATQLKNAVIVDIYAAFLFHPQWWLEMRPVTPGHWNSVTLFCYISEAQYRLGSHPWCWKCSVTVLHVSLTVHPRE